MPAKDYSWIENKGDNSGYTMRRNNAIVGEVTFDKERKGWVWRAGHFYGVDARTTLEEAMADCALAHEDDLNNALRMKRVWVLGSGFSKGVGGPLLNELLTLTSQQKLLAQYKFARQFKPVYEVYWQHCLKRRADYSPSTTPIFWDDAEEFLTFMDSVKRGGYRSKMFLKQHRKTDVEAFYKKCVQARCCRMLLHRE